MEETMQLKPFLKNKFKEQWDKLKGKIQWEKNKKKMLYIGLPVVVVLIVGLCLLTILGGPKPIPRTEDEIITKMVLEFLAGQENKRYDEDSMNWSVEYYEDGISVTCHAKDIDFSIVNSAGTAERASLIETYTPVAKSSSRGYWDTLNSNLKRVFEMEEVPCPIYYRITDKYGHNLIILKNDAEIVYSRY